jgi:hypothetical protein
MSRSIFKPLVLALGMTFGASAGAATITDTITQDAYVSFLGSHTYTHDITDGGFVPGSAISGSLQISIYDDARDRFDLLPELVLVIVDSFDFDSGGLTFGNFDNSLGIQALGSLNADGLLQVKVQSLIGDFRVGTSTLSVEVSEVPVPGTLGLLGAGLAALGLVRRKAAR